MILTIWAIAAIRSVGELLQNQMRLGFSRMDRVIRERMQSLSDKTNAEAKDIVNTRPVSAAIKEFFGSSQLSQFWTRQILWPSLLIRDAYPLLDPAGFPGRGQILKFAMSTLLLW